MNKKLIVTIACLMSVHGASAFRMTDYLPAWSSVPNVFMASPLQASSMWTTVKKQAGTASGWVQGQWNGVVGTYQVASAISAPVVDGYSWAKSNPVGFGVTAYSAGSYPKAVIPALGGITSWYVTKKLNEREDCSWNLTDSKKLLSGVAGAATTFSFMHKPKLTTVVLALAGLISYKKGWGPFARNAQATDENTNTGHNHSDGDGCGDSACEI